MENCVLHALHACTHVCVRGGDKKNWVSHDNQFSINLKSNTMKNTVQNYYIFAIYKRQ